MKVLGLNRAELLVSDADAAQKVFEQMFNGGHYPSDSGLHDRPLDCRVNYQHGLELVCPKNAHDKIGKLLADKGEHIFTVVWEVDSIEAAKKHVVDSGFEIQYEGDYSDKPELEIHKQIVVRPDKTHGLQVIFQERRLKPGAEDERVTNPGLEVLGLQRIELLVKNGAAAEATFDRLFGGLDFERDLDSASRPLDCRVDWKAGIELVQPNSSDEKIGKLLAEKGEHVFTVVWDVNDMDLARKHLSDNGFEEQWFHDFGALGEYDSHKQLVIRPERTHGLLVIFQERRRKRGAA